MGMLENIIFALCFNIIFTFFFFTLIRSIFSSHYCSFTNVILTFLVLLLICAGNILIEFFLIFYVRFVPCTNTWCWTCHNTILWLPVEDKNVSTLCKTGCVMRGEATRAEIWQCLCLEKTLNKTSYYFWYISDLKMYRYGRLMRQSRRTWVHYYRWIIIAATIFGTHAYILRMFAQS